MATSGVVVTTKWKGNNGDRYLYFTWSRASYDTAAQTTTINWNLSSLGSYGGYIMAGPFEVVIDGSQVYYDNSRIKLYSNQQLKSGTTVIKHNVDGSKNFTVIVRCALYSSAINHSGSGTFELPTIGRPSIVSAPNFTDEDNPTITYSNPVGTAATSLDACISFTGAKDDVPYRAIPLTGTTYTFTLSGSERETLRSGTQGANERKVLFYVRCKLGEQFFYSTKEVVFSVINAKPTITTNVEDINAATIALTGDNKTLIRFQSTAQATMEATAYKNATITSQKIEYSGSGNTNTRAITQTFPNVEGNVFTFTATDSRNNTITKTTVLQMVDYIKPTANPDVSELMTPEGVYTLKCSGNYYNDTFGFTDAAVANTLDYAYRYKLQDEEFGEWIAATPTIEGNTYSVDVELTGLDYRAKYVFQCRVIDKLNTVVSSDVIVKSLPVFHWGEEDFVFEVPVEFRAGFSQNESTVVASGSWVPTLSNSEAVASYNVRSGWYQQTGSVITIGWQIKATIKNGYSSDTIAIEGAPFMPDFSAFGGGLLHNCAFAAGFNFEGWVIGSDGVITPRGQPCNNTTLVNLNITSSAYYPTGSSNTDITLGGTICFTGTRMD